MNVSNNIAQMMNYEEAVFSTFYIIWIAFIYFGWRYILDLFHILDLLKDLFLFNGGQP